MSEAANLLLWTRYVVNRKMRFVAEKVAARVERSKTRVRPAAVAGMSEFRLGYSAAVSPHRGARMDADLLAAEDDEIELKGSSIIAAIKASGVEFILSVPDIVTSGGLLRPISRDPAFKLIRVCKEDECIGIASGLSYCDKRALTLIQSTGFLDSINAIRGVAVEYRQPICMMIGLLGHAPTTTPRNSPRYGVRIIEPILDAMSIPHHLINEEADVAKIHPAIDDAYTRSRPLALLIGRRPSAA
jgi:sulfopyruvate decarboxylase subunit alpha